MYTGRNTIKILKTRKVSFEQFLQLHLKQKTTEVESEAEIKDAFGVSVPLLMVISLERQASS